MKKTILTLLILLIPIAYALDICDSPMEPSDIPCTIVSAWNYTPPCNSYSANVYNSIPTLVYTITLGSYGSTGRCNFTFNQTVRDGYTIDDSAGGYGTLIVEGVKMEFFRLIVFVVFMAFYFVFVHFMNQERENNIGSSVAFGSLATVFMVIMGSMIIYGFDVIVTEVIFIFDVNYYLATICYILAFYSVAHSVTLYKSTKPKPNEYEAR